MKKNNLYDVTILGGGLAGLTLALQLKMSEEKLHILVIEKRNADAPFSVHKVGESISELASYYLREVLTLKDYLNEHQLRKFGFRFYFKDGENKCISDRVEFGFRITDPYPTHQMDRGPLENYLVGKLQTLGVNIQLNAEVKHIELGIERNHSITYFKNQLQTEVKSKWVVDSTGRRGILKQKLNLQKTIPHEINSVWFRIGETIDIEDWSTDKEWKGLFEPGKRSLATSHLMGKGYWIWIIRLMSGATSFGIVADPRFHPFDTYSTLPKAIAWLNKHEPQLANVVERNKNNVLDFKTIKNFAYDTHQFYSNERWALTGEAGAFLDPLYSPGSDFIALGNTWINHLIVNDYRGKNIKRDALIFDLAHKELLKGWKSLYLNMYQMFDNTQTLIYKITWDIATYWAIPCLLFINEKYTDIQTIIDYVKSPPSIGNRFSLLNQKMESEFLILNSLSNEKFQKRLINIFELKTLLDLYTDLREKSDTSVPLIKIIEVKLQILEQFAAAILSLLSAKLKDTPNKMPFDPYEMSLSMEKHELELASLKVNIHPSEQMHKDVNLIWLKQ